MNFKTLRSRLQPFEPVFLTAGEPGSLRVLEKSAHAVCDILPDDLADEEQVVSQVQAVLSKSVDSDQQPPIRLSIALLHEGIAQDGICRALVALAEFLGPAVGSQILIHLDQPSADWSVIQSLVKLLGESLGRPNQASVQLVAPFGEFDEAKMEALFNLGVRVRFAFRVDKGVPARSNLAG